MTTLQVDLGRRSYPIDIGPDILDQVSLHAAKQRQMLVVSNETIAPLYLDAVLAALPSATSLVLPDGEQYKSLATVSSILDALADAGFSRDCLLVALGGGVIGDLTGFAAAAYHRGVDFIQLPTTLLAMVDSSVGGKTGVNHRAGKNLIGAFHQPIAVIASLDTLSTLPEREYLAGVAEVLKYALLGDLEFLDWLEQNSEKVLARDSDTLSEIVVRCCRAKAEIVAADERESGQRALLNLGHTFGHAIENAMGYGSWLHGEAVAAGMVMAADLSHRLGWLDAPDLQRVRAITAALGLPVHPPAIEPERFLALMYRDKKVLAGQMRLVLLRGLGDAVITSDASSEQLQACLEGCLPGASR